MLINAVRRTADLPQLGTVPIFYYLLQGTNHSTNGTHCVGRDLQVSNLAYVYHASVAESGLSSTDSTYISLFISRFLTSS
jgi:hypothetical protein